MRTINRILLSVAMLVAAGSFSTARNTADSADRIDSTFAAADKLARNSQYAAAENAFLKILDENDDELVRIRTCIKLAELYFMSGNADKTLIYTDNQRKLPITSSSTKRLCRTQKPHSTPKCIPRRSTSTEKP